MSLNLQAIKHAYSDAMRAKTGIGTATFDAEFEAALQAHVDELQARLDRVRALAEEWRYKGERGPTWYEAYGPNPEDHILDNASDDLLQALDGEATE